MTTPSYNTSFLSVKPDTIPTIPVEELFINTDPEDGGDVDHV